MRAGCAFEPKPVHHLSSAPSRFSPSWTSRFGWEPLDQSGLSIPGPSISVTTGWIPQSSHLQLQVTTRLDVATEATFLEHLTGLKIFLVHIKEWEELGLEGAEDLTWYCHYHLFSEKKKEGWEPWEAGTKSGCPALWLL